MLVLRIVLVALVLPLATFLFGWAVLTRFTQLDREERFASAWAVGVGVLAASQYAVFLLGIEQSIFNAGTLCLMFGVVAYCVWSREKLQIADGRLQIENANLQSTGCNLQSPFWFPVLWLLGYLHLFVIQSLLPLYIGSYWYGDWCMHFYTAQIFRGNAAVKSEWAGYTLASRTPVFNLTTAFFQSLVGDEFWVYQIAATLLNYCFVAPLYLVLRDLAGARLARVALVLVPLNLWMLHVAWFTWSKMLAGYFLLLGLHCYLQFVQHRQSDPATARRYFLGFWACAWTGFLTHQVGLLYVAALVLHAAWLAWRDGEFAWLTNKTLLNLIVVFGVLTGAWYGWLAHVFGLSEVGGRTPVTRMDTSQAFTLGSVLFYVGFVLFASLVPMRLLQVLFEGPGLWQERWGEELYDGATQMYFSLFTGALTLSLLTFLAMEAFAWLFRQRRSEPDRPTVLQWIGGLLTCIPVGIIGVVLLRWLVGPWQRSARPFAPCWSAIWLFAFFGVVGGAVLHPAKMPWGIAHAALFPTVVLLVGLAWTLLARTRGTVVLLVALGIVIEFLFMFWTHVWLVVEAPGWLDPSEADVPRWGNSATKRGNEAVFLNDLLNVPDPADAKAVRELVREGRVEESHFPAGIAAALVLQMVFIFLTFRWLRAGPEPEEDVGKDVELVSSG